MKLKSNHLSILVVAFALSLLCNFCLAQSAVTSVESNQKAIMPAKQAAVFKKYCYDCHDSASEEAGIDLEGISFDVGRDIENAERWSKILNAINSGEMPPKDSTQIADADKLSFLDDLSNQMVLARKILSDSGGVVTMRRLNRREYQNTLEALLGFRPDVSALPDDQAMSGFDTAGASLFFSSDQLELYLATAKSNLELALLPRPKLESKTVRIEPEAEFIKRYSDAADVMRDRMARAKAYYAQKEKPPSEFGFIDDYQAKNQKVAEWLPLLEQYLARPETKTGVAMIITIKQGGISRIKFPALSERAAGKYLIRLRAAVYPDVDSRFQYLEFVENLGGKQQKRLGWRKVSGTLENPQIVEFLYEHSPGVKSSIQVSQRSHQDRGDKNLATIDMKKNGFGTPPGTWVDWGEMIGPLSDQQYRELTGQDSSKGNSGFGIGSSPEVPADVLFEKPDDWSPNRYAKEVINRFAERAFRGESPDPEFLDRLYKQFAANRAKGQKFNQAMVGPLAVVLSSPSFLYMVESTGNADSQGLTETELAVRLSYFLWSAPPDKELMELAVGGKLSEPEVLKSQTNRLLSDERADRFLRGFVHQWLEMERLDMFQFDGVRFPTFDNAARENAREEIFETVRTLIEEKLPLKNLLKSDFVVVNDLMADFYELPVEVKGHEFKKIKLPPNSKRGGLMGTAAVLAMGSDGLRSSPVERGVWVLRHLLNNPPPPAPPNVPQLGRLAGEILDSRSLQRAHQEEPQCAQCHQKIDPIGYALENFNAAGLWRDKETVTIGRRGKSKSKEFEIDTSGQLSSGKKFADYFQLRDVVAEHDDQLAHGLAEALIEYGLGRPYGFTDQELADKIVKQSKPSQYLITEFIHALIQSKTFQTK